MSDTGWVAVSSASGDGTGSPFGTYTWTNPQNVYSSDDAYASSSTSRFSATKGLICNLAGYSSIPSGATINGLMVLVEGYALSNAPLSIIQTDDNSTAYGIYVDIGSLLSGVLYGGSDTSIFGVTNGTWTKNENVIGIAIFGRAGADNHIYIDQICFKWFYTQSSIKMVNGLAKASVKTINGLAIASIKGIDGLT